MTARGFRAVGPGLESYRRARQMMIVAWSKPKPSHFHVWRRYVRITGFTSGCSRAGAAITSSATERRIEALDGVLGSITT